MPSPGIDGRRSESTMNLRERDNHRVSLHYGGWTARPFSLCLTIAAEAFVLTSSFIERDYRNVLPEANAGEKADKGTYPDLAR